MLSRQFSQKYAIKIMTHKACYLLPQWAGTPGFYGHMIQRTWTSEWSGPGSLLSPLLDFSHHTADMTFSLALGDLCGHLPLREITCTNGLMTNSYLEGISDPSALIKHHREEFVWAYSLRELDSMMMGQRDEGRSTKLSVHILNCKSKAGRMNYKQ